MPIHRGPRLDDLISRFAHVAMPIAANVYKTWPNLAAGLSVAGGGPGVWVEFISAVNAPTVPFTIAFVNGYSDGGGLGLVEIGVGGAGVERAVASAGICGDYTSDASVSMYSVPTPLPIIPGGSRVSVRVYLTYAITLKIVSALLPTRLDPYNTLRLADKLSSYYGGISAMSGNGPSVSNPATAWTYGGFYEAWAAAVEASPSIITGISYLNINTGFAGQLAFATGALGAEIVWGEFPSGGSGTGSACHFDLPIPIIVPGSSRHSVKFASAGAASTILRYPTPTFSKGAFLP